MKRKEHFASVVGLTVDIKLFAPDAKGRKLLRGVLKSADENGITVDVDGEETNISYSSVAKANTFFEF